MWNEINELFIKSSVVKGLLFYCLVVFGATATVFSQNADVFPIEPVCS